MKVTDIMKKRMSFSFEVFPPKAEQSMEPLLDTLEHLYAYKPDFISCTYGAGGTNVGRNMEICKAIKESGKTIPVTHYTCIGNKKEKIREELETYLKMGVNHILALRGDFPKGWQETRGDFDHANELVEYIRTNFPEFCIAVAGNPEKHIQAGSLKEDIAHLRLKQDAGGDYIMTQLCYDVKNYQCWVEQIRKAGVTLPIDAGIMPVLSKDPTIRMTVSNGCSIPKELAEIIGKYGDSPEDFKKAGKEYTVKLIYDYINMGIDGLHIYTLNKWQDVADIIKNAGIRSIKE
ncbi:5,10-methylenetetrahydrofolate reductase [Tepidanaerobacter syntrophicus]|mgnify:CR=1 FL=1|uniref:Methylenetetrahydrofolate reductase n=2 Tax=Tepidanaerobacteraceae TaxID=2770092 RepID=A0A0U9HEQ5_9FIRM|nr:methylenetetrahydrofolate reductase [Tepidanaerobacter syntrophicus]GAQ25305.1 methylenetetrahydrofolate reductase [Tepidanaerobacter syntrophicus]GLI18776.1 5,10-methylenetetrahydrofolate reductase [Tepidanaerobacter syntrophicus]GLI50852.1 5,10-methylenetetrahydrofolate reductase [Tepidanaerobacter syntrophicus]